MRRHRGLAALVASAVAFSGLGLAMAGVAHAAPTSPFTPTLSIRRADTTAFPTVKVDAQLIGGNVNTSSFNVSENGKPVSALQVRTLTQVGRPVGTVLVVDTASSMNSLNKLAAVKAAAKQYVAQKMPSEVMAVVAAGAVARVVVNFTADAGQLNAAIDALGGSGEMALYDAVRASAALFDSRPELLANMIVIADRRDTLSKTKLPQAEAAARDAHAIVFTVGLPGDPDFDSSALQGFASGGGQYLQPASATAIPSAMAAIQTALQSGVEISYLSGLANSSLVGLQITVAANGLEDTIHTVPGGVAAGSNATPAVVHVPGAPGPLKGKLGVLLIAVMALTAVALLVYALVSLATAEKATLAKALQPYTEGVHVTPDDSDDISFVQTAVVAKAVEATARIARERGVLDRVEGMLEQADLSLRPAEALFFYLVAGVVIVIAAGALFGVFGAFLALVIAILVPPATVSFLATRRLRKFTAQLPDTLELLASSLRAGFSFMQGVEAVANESPKPMGDELRRVMVEARLGRPLEQALQDCADRMRSPDFDWAVMAVNIQREVGGNLAELLQTVGETMIQRERLRRDVRALTAEGRVSAIVLAILPPALGVLFYVSNPEYMKVLFTHLGGQIALGIAIILGIGGFLWMKKIVDIEV